MSFVVQVFGFWSFIVVVVFTKMHHPSKVRQSWKIKKKKKFQ